MKKVILLGLLICFVITLFAVSDSLEVKSYIFYKKMIVLPYPLCKKVFPGVDFYVKFDISRSHTHIRESLIAEYNNKYYSMPFEFNLLLKNFVNQPNLEIYDYVTLYLQMTSWAKEHIVEVDNFQKLTYKRKKTIAKKFGNSYNYIAKVKIDKIDERRLENFTALIKIKNHLIEEIHLYNSKLYICLHPL